MAENSLDIQDNFFNHFISNNFCGIDDSFLHFIYNIFMWYRDIDVCESAIEKILILHNFVAILGPQTTTPLHNNG